MRKIIFAVLLTLFLSGLCFAQDSLSRPVIQFDQKVYDFGRVNRDTMLVHIFKFKNLGNKTLKIKGVRPG